MLPTSKFNRPPQRQDDASNEVEMAGVTELLPTEDEQPQLDPIPDSTTTILPAAPSTPRPAVMQRLSHNADDLDKDPETLPKERLNKKEGKKRKSQAKGVPVKKRVKRIAIESPGKEKQQQKKQAKSQDKGEGDHSISSAEGLNKD